MRGSAIRIALSDGCIVSGGATFTGSPLKLFVVQTGVCPAMKPGPRRAWNYLNSGWTKVSHPKG